MNMWQNILTSRSERPELLGIELDAFPFISGFGVALRIYRLCCLEPKDLFPVLGIRAWTNLNLLQACHRPGACRTRFEKRIGLDKTLAPAYWNVSVWSPLDLHGYWSSEELPLRHCPECVRYGYHCTLFQLPSIDRCPWHGLALRDRCIECNEPYSSNITAETDVGRCTCGHDLFDGDMASAGMWRFPHVEASDTLTEYLAWAEGERSHRHFLAPCEESVGRFGFSRLAAPPMAWNKVAKEIDPVVTTYYRDRTSEPMTGAFWGWCLLRSERPLTLIRLSTRTHRRLVAISKPRLRQQAPETSKTSKRLTKKARADIANISAVEKFIPPLDINPGPDCWLRLSAVDPRALRTCAHLTEAVCEYVSDIDSLDLVLSPSVQRAKSLDRVEGRGYLDRALEAVLVRGYVQGLDALCRIHMHQPSRVRKWVAPIAEVVGSKGFLEDIRICWAPVAPLTAQPTPEMTDTKKARTKRPSRAPRAHRLACRVVIKRKAR
jgi:hypothetical protein